MNPFGLEIFPLEEILEADILTVDWDILMESLALTADKEGSKLY